MTPNITVPSTERLDVLAVFASLHLRMAAGMASDCKLHCVEKCLAKRKSHTVWKMEARLSLEHGYSVNKSNCPGAAR